MGEKKRTPPPRKPKSDYETQIADLTQRLAECKATMQALSKEQARKARAQNEQLLAVRRAAEAERNFASAVLDTAGALVIVLDRQGQIVRFNHACEQVTGYSFDEVKGKRFWDFLLLPEQVQPVRAVFDQLSAGQFPQVYENYWVARDGSHVLIAWRNTALLGPQDTVEYIIGTGLDVTERKRAEVALKESEARFRLALKNAPVSVAVQDRNLRFNWAYNQRTVRSTDIIGRTDADLFLPEDAARLIALKRKALETGAEVREQFWLTSGGRQVFVDLFLEPIKDEVGQVTGVGIATVDLTERKRAEEELHESEARLKRAQEIAHLGSWELDLVQNRLAWSDEVYRIFGLQPQEFGATYEAFLEHVHPDDRAAVDTTYSASLRENRDTYEIEHRVVRKSTGETRIVREKCEHLRDAAGKIIRSVGMIHDITDLKRAEEEIKSMAKFPAENPSPILRLSPEGVILYANTAGGALLEEWGCTTGDTAPVEWRDIIAEAFASQLSKTVDLQCSGRIYSMYVVPTAEKSYVNLYGRDITERVQAEQEREQLLKENCQQSELLEQLMAVAPVGITVVRGPDHRYEYVNPAYQMIPGTLGVRMVGRTIAEVFPAAAAKGAVEMVEAVYRTGQTVSVSEYEASVGPGREQTFWNVDHVPLRDPGGEVDRVLILANEVTVQVLANRQMQEYAEQLRITNQRLQLQSEELQAQGTELREGTKNLQQLMDALEAERARLTAILRQMPAGVIIADASTGQVVLANEQMDQLLHGRYRQVGSPDRYLRYETYFLNGRAYLSKESPLARTLSAGEIVMDEEMSFVRDDGSRAVVLTSSSPIRDREGHIIAGVMTFHDITDRKRAEEQAQQLAAIQERQRLARELHDSVSQALYGIALGARTARTLLDCDPRQAVEPLDYVQTLAGAGLAEMRALIFELRPESLEIEGLVAAITKQVDATRARHEIEIRAALCDEPQVPLDIKQAFYRIAQESLHNAVKHAKATRLDVTLNYAEGEITLEVRDNGVGFEPGASFPGHLGLRSMRERVMRLGGVLEIDSAPGAGACICARVPIRKPG